MWKDIQFHDLNCSQVMFLGKFGSRFHKFQEICLKSRHLAGNPQHQTNLSFPAIFYDSIDCQFMTILLFPMALARSGFLL